METSSLIKIFSSIAISTLFIFSISQVGYAVYQSVAEQGTGYEENTYLGPINISGLSEAEALTKVSAEVSSWLEQNIVQLSFNGESTPVPSDYFTFLLDQSLASVMNGKQNQLMVTVSDVELKMALVDSIYPIAVDEVDMEKLKLNIELIATALSNEITTLTVQDYFTTDAFSASTTISEASLSKIPNDIDLQSYAHLFSTINVPANSELSLHVILTDNGVPHETASVLATLLYKTILPTNFNVIERQMSAQLPVYGELGYEAKVSEHHDFVIYNPNSTDYVVEIENTSDGIQATLTGLPLPYQYKVEIVDSEVHKQKVIIQYDANLEIGQKKVSEAGKEGLSATVMRQKLDQKGQLLEKQLISKDFYPPVHTVELHSLKVAINFSSIEETVEETEVNDDSSELGEETDDTQEEESDLEDSEEEIIEK
ncbi:hypothetical protein [Bacillus sp. AK128]